MVEVGYVLLGWLLGVLNPLITRHGERKRRRKEIGEGLRAEISELRVRLAMTCFLVTLRYGDFDRAFLTWLKPLLERYEGAHPARKTIETLEKVLAYPDKEIALFAAHDRVNPDKSLSLKKYRLPYLEANLGNLDLFSERTKLLLMETAAQMETINEEIEQVRFYYGLTFDSSLSDENHKLARYSVAESSMNVATTGREVLNKLMELECAVNPEQS